MIDRDYLKFMTSDLPMQFRTAECGNNRILLKALAKQLDDVLEAFDQLGKRTYLRLLFGDETGDSLTNGAHGIQLDRIGEVVDLTRKQATIVSNKIESINDIAKSGYITDDTLIRFIRDNFTTYYPDNSLEDPEYSEYLFYKIFLNSSYCTYSDVIKSLRMFWSTTPIYYSEDKDEPATIILSTPELRPEQNARLFFLAPVVKAAGVKLYREAVTVDDVRDPQLYLGGGLFNGVIQSTLPYLVIDHEYKQEMSASALLENVVEKASAPYEALYEYHENSIRLKAAEYGKHGALVYPAFFDGKLVEKISGQSNMSDGAAKTVFIPSTVTEIAASAFANFTALESLSLPQSITTVGASAFNGCTALKTAVISPNAVIAEIPQEAFAGCTQLREIVLPAAITSIAAKAFEGCNSIERVAYGGTQAEWDAIQRTADNGSLFTAEIEFIGGSNQ